jgi:hypothetical protein
MAISSSNWPMKANSAWMICDARGSVRSTHRSHMDPGERTLELDALMPDVPRGLYLMHLLLNGEDSVCAWSVMIASSSASTCRSTNFTISPAMSMPVDLFDALQAGR